MSQKDYLEQLPYAAFELRDGLVAALNTAAQTQLPSLIQGAPLPAGLAQPLSQQGDAGRFELEGRTFWFSRAISPAGQTVFFRPAQDSALTGEQVDGFSRRMRDQLGDLLGQLSLLSSQVQDQQEAMSRVAQLNRSFHQITHLVNNLEFLNLPDHQAQAMFCPVPMDLAQLCRTVAQQSADVLEKRKVTLSFTSPLTSLLIPGDPALLRRMLLALISNAVKAAPGGTVSLSLQQREDRAVLTLWDSSQQEADLSQLFQPHSGDAIPAPGDGAGMGLGVVRRIVELHNGALVTAPGTKGGLVWAVSLPTGPLPASMPLNSPKMESDGGLSPVLLELADLLPPELYFPDDL